MTPSIKQLPWRAIRRGIKTLRRLYFDRPKPATKTIDESLPTVRRRLISDGYEGGWYLSYQYKSEDANLRKPAGRVGAKYRQIHVRLWETDDGRTEVNAHREYSPIQHPKSHLRNEDMEDATDHIRSKFDA